MAIISVQGLRKSYKSRGKKKGGTVEAVKGIDLTVQKGEIFGFLGPNGAGKSTTLKMLSTLLAPDGGKATIAGFDLLAHPARVRRQIGYVSQAGGADGSATGREDLMLQAQLFGLSEEKARRRANELITALELEPFVDRFSRTYSGGQRRKLDIALGMVHQPAVLFLDEPTTGLDPVSRAQLWSQIRQLRSQGTTVFLTTHYMDEADVLCDRIAIIDKGRIVAEDSPSGLKRQHLGRHPLPESQPRGRRRRGLPGSPAGPGVRPRNERRRLQPEARRDARGRGHPRGPAAPGEPRRRSGRHLSFPAVPG